MSRLWFSTPALTCLVVVTDGTISDTAPILRRFQGQPFANLWRWAHGKWPREVRIEPLPDSHS